MNKVKTKKAVSKRFKVTKTGKVLHGVQGARHLRRKKSKSRQRKQDRAAEITNPKFKRLVKQFVQT